MNQIVGNLCKRSPLVKQAAEVDIELVDRGQITFNVNINAYPDIQTVSKSNEHPDVDNEVDFP